MRKRPHRQFVDEHGYLITEIECADGIHYLRPATKVERGMDTARDWAHRLPGEIRSAGQRARRNLGSIGGSILRRIWRWILRVIDFVLIRLGIRSRFPAGVYDDQADATASALSALVSYDHDHDRHNPPDAPAV